MSKRKKNITVYLVQLAILTAILALFAFTPLGYLKITPAIGATLAHIPVIIAAIVLGKWAGIYMGSLFGFLSFISFTFMYPADPMAPAFTPFAENAIMGKSWLSLIIVFVPRILLGYFTAIIYSALEKHTNGVLVHRRDCPIINDHIKNNGNERIFDASWVARSTELKRPVSATIAAVLGTILHSFMVLSLIYLIFGSVYSNGQKYVSFIIAWAGVNCLMEIAVAALISAALVVPLKKIIEA